MRLALDTRKKKAWGVLVMDEKKTSGLPTRQDHRNAVGLGKLKHSEHSGGRRRTQGLSICITSEMRATFKKEMFWHVGVSREWKVILVLVFFWECKNYQNLFATYFKLRNDTRGLLPAVKPMNERVGEEEKAPRHQIFFGPLHFFLEQRRQNNEK